MLVRLPSCLRPRLLAAPLAGALLLAVADAVDIAATVPMPPGGVRARAAHHAFSALTLLALGFASGVTLGTAGRALRGRRAAAGALYFGAGVVLSYLVLGQDLRHQADYVLTGLASDLLFALFVGLCGAALPVAHGLGGWLGRRRYLRWAALAAAIGGMVASRLVVRDDYAAMHAAIDWTACTVAFASLHPLVVHARRRRAGRAFFGALALAGLVGLVVPPPNGTRLQLFRTPGAIGAWALAHTVWPAPGARAATAADAPPVRAAPAPPTLPPLAGEAPVVVMITIDALRADVVLEKPHASSFVYFSELRRTGAVFTRAISPGSQTSVSLSTMFAGRYFSQLYWSRHGVGPSRFLYPAEDPTPRFPEILVKHGVRTALFGGTNFLANDFGVARGFEVSKVPTTRKHALANDVVRPLLDRLNAVGDDEPTFLYAHIMEPHAPYDRGKKKGTDHERYVSEVGLADSQVARVGRVLAQRFPTRGVLIVSADHGEAFGEHGTFHHTKTLYDELLHVPLIVRGPGVRARRIGTRVGLIDIGPTVLDLFGIETPPGFMGESLVPALRGGAAPSARPILAEGRLRRALYTDGVKVIDDTRRKVVEAYDLGRDPGELVNLFDEGDPRADAALATLRAFFEAHSLKKPGYSPPYKP